MYNIYLSEINHLINLWGLMDISGPEGTIAVTTIKTIFFIVQPIITVAISKVGKR